MKSKRLSSLRNSTPSSTPPYQTLKTHTRVVRAQLTRLFTFSSSPKLSEVRSTSPAFTFGTFAEESFPRVQECGSSSSSSSDLPIPSCIRSKRALFLRASVVSTHCVGTQAGRKDVSVSPNIHWAHFAFCSDASSSLQTLRSYLPCSSHHN